MKTHLRPAQIVLWFAGVLVVALGISALCGPHVGRVAFAQTQYYDDSSCYGLSNPCPLCDGSNYAQTCDNQYPDNWGPGYCVANPFYPECAESSFNCGNQYYCADDKQTGSDCYNGPICQNG